MEDDEFVLSEVERLRYVYKLKKEIRYAQNREEVLDTESVAEHIFGMHVLANYFFILENTDSKMDKLKVLEMITWHDIDEIETGDILAYAKTEQDRVDAKKALSKVIARLPEINQANVKLLLDEYETQVSPEAKFVKAIDKIEPMFEVHGEGYKTILHNNKNTLEQHWSPRRRYLEGHPYIWRFASITTDYMVREGYFVPEA